MMFKLKMALAVVVFSFLFLFGCQKAELTPEQMALMPCHQMSNGTMMGKCEEPGDSSHQMMPGMEMSGMEMSDMKHVPALIAQAGNSNEAVVGDYMVHFAADGRNTASSSSLTFTLSETNSAAALSDLDIVHDKPIHLVLVRDDLTYFDHIHPAETEPGTFTVPYTFYAPGNYRLWVDFTKDGQQYIVDFDTEVEGVERQKPSDLDGVQVKMKKPKMVAVGTPAQLDFTVTDTTGNPAPITEKFLAANAHLIEIGAGWSEFEHNHDMDFDGDNVLSFTPTFAESGQHKVWVQFSVEGKARTAEFPLQVEK